MRSLIVRAETALEAVPALPYKSLQDGFIGELTAEVTFEAAESFDFDSLSRHQFGPLQIPEFDELTPFRDEMVYEADRILQKYQVTYLEFLARNESTEYTPETRLVQKFFNPRNVEKTSLRLGVREIIKVRMLLRLRSPSLARQPLSRIEASTKPDDDLLAIAVDEYQNLVAMRPELRGDLSLAREVMDATGVPWEIAVLAVGTKRHESVSRE